MIAVQRAIAACADPTVLHAVQHHIITVNVLSALVCLALILAWRCVSDRNTLMAGICVGILVALGCVHMELANRAWADPQTVVFTHVLEYERGETWCSYLGRHNR